MEFELADKISMREFRDYLAAIYGVYSALSEAERQELHEWEEENLGKGDSKIATSDWPGWVKYIGPPPKLSREENLDKSGFVYIIKIQTGEFKIGKSINVEKRIKEIDTSTPHELELVHAIISDNANNAEKLLHKKYEKSRIKGEWFNLSSNDIDELLVIEKFEEGIFYKSSG